MSSALSDLERQHAYRLLGVDEQELVEIDRLPDPESEDQLKVLKGRVRRTFKHLVYEYHPDHNPGDERKALIFGLLVRAAKELYARQVNRDASGVGHATSTWRVHSFVTPSGVPKPFMPVSSRGPRSGKRPDPREQAVRLGKMRP